MKKLLIFLMLIPFVVCAQSTWKPSEQPLPENVELFHSKKTANYPTTEMLNKNNFMFEISHRFGKISQGYDNLYGFDGPVNMRIALSYGITDNFMLTLGRSAGPNLTDNLQLDAKTKIWQLDNKTMPSTIALRGGIAFNTEPIYDLKLFDKDYIQYFGQLIYNVMFFDKQLGIGLVPSFVYNSYIFAARNKLDTKSTFTLGTYYQYYFNRKWSVWAEYGAVINGWKGNILPDASTKNRSYNPIAFGVAIETGGHIFHLMVTNSTRLNATQFLVGADSNTNKDAWLLGFGITREL